MVERLAAARSATQRVGAASAGASIDGIRARGADLGEFWQERLGMGAAANILWRPDEKWRRRGRMISPALRKSLSSGCAEHPPFL